MQHCKTLGVMFIFLSNVPEGEILHSVRHKKKKKLKDSGWTYIHRNY